MSTVEEQLRSIEPAVDRKNGEIKTDLLIGQEEGLDLDVAPDEYFLTTKKELWSFYLYYVGNSGLGLFNFAPSQFQNLMYLAGVDGADHSIPCGDGLCVLPFAGSYKQITSIVYIANGISFALQAVLFLIIGAYADYGRWRPFILIAFTVLSISISFAWLGVENPAQWQTGVGLYIIGLIAYQGALTFWTAAFPALARDLPEMQESKRRVIDGTKSAEEHVQLDSLSRNRVSNMSFTICSLGELVVLAILVGILKGVHSSRSVEDNTRALSIVVAYSAGVYLVLALPWFWFEKYRPGLKLPRGYNYFTVGFHNVAMAFKGAWQLRDTLTYLVVFFLLSDCLNTTVTVIATLQNSIVTYNTEQLNYLLIVGIATQMVGIYAFWRIQKYAGFSTKTMFVVVVLCIILLNGWGLIGIWTDKFGFKHVWELYAYQAFYGLFVCPWYAYSQTMISEVIPPGKEFLFFALFSIIGKTSAFIGPFVSSAIVDRSTANGDRYPNNMPFAFLFALTIVSSFLIFFIDVKRSRINCRLYLEKELALSREKDRQL